MPPKKILFISMPSSSVYFGKKYFNFPNLGLLSIASNLRGNHAIKILDDYDIEKKASIAEGIRQFNPDIVGLSSMIFQYENAKGVAAYIKKEYPHILIVLGGYHATLMYKDIYDSEEGNLFDFIVRGEGEVTFNKLVEQLSSGDFAGLKGLSYRHGKEVVHNEEQENIDLCSLKPPDRGLIKNGNYYAFDFVQRSRFALAVIETSRGCLYGCNFCCIRKMYSKSFRTYPIERVMEDIRQAKQNGAEIIFFSDDNILIDTERMIKLCEAIIDNGFHDIRYFVQCSSIGLAKSEEMVKIMKKAGFHSVFLGIENNKESSLKFLKKGDITNVTQKAIAYLHKHNIGIMGGIIIGMPDDDSRSLGELYRYVRKMGIEFPAIQMLTPYPKTEIRESYLESNLVTNKMDYRMYDGFWANIKTHHLSSDDLLHTKLLFDMKTDILYKYISRYYLRNMPLTFLLHIFMNPLRYLMVRFKYRGRAQILKLLDQIRHYYLTVNNIENYM